MGIRPALVSSSLPMAQPVPFPSFFFLALANTYSSVSCVAPLDLGCHSHQSLQQSSVPVQQSPVTTYQHLPVSLTPVQSNIQSCCPVTSLTAAAALHVSYCSALPHPPCQISQLVFQATTVTHVLVG